jgi:trans-AT polyketide synthase, acyltransferase and oxidoreductase domains
MSKIFVFPGQGSQAKGMGEELFDAYPELVAKADEVLGYSIKTLCLEDPDENINLTQYTQPALYTVEALEYLKRKDAGETPEYVAGHSLGEYAALFAAGAYDFKTGVKLVQKRGELMGKAKGGGMAAIIGMDAEAIQENLKKLGKDTIDVANYNAPGQIILSGPVSDLDDIADPLEEAGAKRVIVLKVSAAFHSRYMVDAQKEFAAFIETIDFNELSIPVIANVTAKPYENSQIRENLTKQIASSVRWQESIEYILDNTDEAEFEEIGPGKALSGMISRIKKAGS